MSPKLLLALVVVLVLLFGAALGVRAFTDGVTAREPGVLLKGLDKVVLKQALDTRDIEPAPAEACVALLAAGSHELNPSSRCVFTIKESTDRPPFLTRVRTLTLRQIVGEVTVTYDPVDEDQLTANPELCKDWTTLQVFEEGGRLTITCESDPCQIEVREQVVRQPGCMPGER